MFAHKHNSNSTFTIQHDNNIPQTDEPTSLKHHRHHHYLHLILIDLNPNKNSKILKNKARIE